MSSWSTRAIVPPICCKTKKNKKLTRSKNVVFDKTKVLGFKNETRNIEDDLHFDVFFDEEKLEADNQNMVKTENKGKKSVQTIG